MSLHEPLVIASFPGAGGSVVAEVLYRLGVYMGDSSQPAHKHVPWWPSHFECYYFGREVAESVWTLPQDRPNAGVTRAVGDFHHYLTERVREGVGSGKVQGVHSLLMSAILAQPTASDIPMRVVQVDRRLDDAIYAFHCMLENRVEAIVPAHTDTARLTASIWVQYENAMRNVQPWIKINLEDLLGAPEDEITRINEVCELNAEDAWIEAAIDMIVNKEGVSDEHWYSRPVQ